MTTSAIIEDAYRNSGKRAVDYMEPEAFSPARLAEGKAAFQQKCGVCHTDSGRDMVMFGNPDFNAARVAGSVKKFAGAMQDPEIGEKVFEYLRYNNPGPFMSQHELFLQPGPAVKGPGQTNAVLSERDDFWGALTGHRVPTPEDVAISKVWNSYEWTSVAVPFKLLSWSQFMPHAVPLPAAQTAAREAFKKQKYDLTNLPLPNRGLGGSFNNDASKIWVKYQFASHDKDKADHSKDTIEAMYSESYLSWLSVLDMDYGLPQWQDGGWKGQWAFGPYENPILWKAGSALVHLDTYGINPQEKRDSRTLNRHLWTYYPNMFVTGEEEVFKPSTYFYGATIPWSCRTGDTGRYGGADIQIFTGLKHYAEMWNHSQTYPAKQYPGTKALPDYGNATRRYLLSIYTPYTGMQYHKQNREAVVNPFLEVVYQQWKASVGATDADLRSFRGVDASEVVDKEQARWNGLANTFNLLQNTLTDRQKDFVKAFVRRLYPTNTNLGFTPAKWELFATAPGKPVILPFGSDLAVAGRPYRLRVLRAQAVDGDITVSTENLPEGADLIRSQGHWAADDYDYAIEWTPSPAQAGKTYVVTLKGASSLGTDVTTATIRVASQLPAPALDAIADRSVYVGQELSFPLTVGSYQGDALMFAIDGGFGRVVDNAWNTAGIYTVKPVKADIGVHHVTFTVTDSRGNRSSTTATIRVYANEPPIVAVLPAGSGPGANKNIYRVRVGDTLKLTIDAFDPEGDPLEISKNADFPGVIDGNEYTYTVDADVAANFPGPNVLTFVVRDLDPNRNDPYNPRYKGGEVYKVLLVYFEAADASRNHTPWAVAGPNQTVKSGAPVQLDGSAADDTDKDPITYRWSQVSGPPVTLSDSGAVRPGFTAPKVTAETILKFYLTVTDPGGLADSGVVRVKVMP
ncbi:MAG TPA: hypothetical protein VGK74_01135 [Symbiobacteriaceae bacterium]